MRRQERSTRYGWRNPRPTWWVLYVIAALLVAVVGLVEMFVEGEGVRKVLIWVWLRGNRIALEMEQARRRARCSRTWPRSCPI